MIPFPYSVEVDDHSDDCGTVYRLNGPGINITSKDEEYLTDRCNDLNFGFARGVAHCNNDSSPKNPGPKNPRPVPGDDFIDSF